MKKVTVYLDETLWRALRIACLAEGISASQKMTQWIQAYLATREAQPPPQETRS